MPPFPPAGRPLALVLAAGLAAVLGGCAAAPPPAEAALVGTTWVLDRIVAPDGPTVRGTGSETLTFGADGRLGVASCNQCSGGYALARGGLTLREDAGLACTRRGCPEGAIELERYVGGAQAVRRDGEFLVVAPAPGEAGPWLVFLPQRMP